MRAVGGAGIVIPAEAEKGGRPPFKPPRNDARHCRAGWTLKARGRLPIPPPGPPSLGFAGIGNGWE